MCRSCPSTGVRRGPSSRARTGVRAGSPADCQRRLGAPCRTIQKSWFVIIPHSDLSFGDATVGACVIVTCRHEISRRFVASQ